jgi:hypothetical protein
MINKHRETLLLAASLFESAPDHTPYGQAPAPGCYCLATALDKAMFKMNSYRTELLVHDAVRDFNPSVNSYPPPPPYDGRTKTIAWNAEHTTEETLALLRGLANAPT